MNCKPSDMAVIVGSSRYAGMLVDVIARAPTGMAFDLPNGYPSQQVDSDCCWIIKSLGSIFKAPTNIGWIFNEYGVGDDKYMRPIRPGDLHETEEDRKEVTA